MNHRRILLLFAIWLCVFLCTPAFGQTPSETSVDSTFFLKDSTSIPQDSSSLHKDSLAPEKSSALEDKMIYMAKDSIYIDLYTRRAQLFHEASIQYQTSNLTANYMELDFDGKEVLAVPTPDSLGNPTGIPHFNDNGSEFDAKQILYNFDTKKGLIKNVLTQEGEMWVHGKTVKKLPNDITYIKGASFTTCDLEHPHFDIRSFRAKIIPEDKIVIGASMVFIEDIPTPLVLPFGLFPATKSFRSGLIIPAIGQTLRSGFFLRGLGYYFFINDYIDLKVDGDIYTGGDWEARLKLRYAKRYKFTGAFNFGYSMILSGSRGPENIR